MTILELEGWFCVYFGFGLIRASLISSDKKTPENNLWKMISIPGYLLMAIGVLILAMNLLGQLHRSKH